MAEVQTAEAKERKARDLLDRLDAALKARQAAKELNALEDRLIQAEAFRTRLEAGEAELALIAVPAEAVDRLQDLEIQIAGLHAAEEAGLPTLRMAYDDGIATPITMDGLPIPDGEERSFGKFARLQIPGVGTLTLRSNQPDRAESALSDARKKRQELLAGLGVDSLADARRRQAAAQEQSSEVAGLRLHLRHLAPEGLQKLREQVAHHSALGSEALELEGDPEETRQSLAGAIQKVSDARNRVREVQFLRARADDALVAAETALATLKAELGRADAVLGPQGERLGREQKLAGALGDRQATFKQLEATAGGLRGAAPDLESAEAALRRARSVEESTIQEATRLHVTLAELNGQIRSRSEDAVEEAWREVSDSLATAAERVKKFETEIAVLDRLRTALQASRSAARDLYLRPVLTELQPLLGLLFDDVSIVFDDKTLLPQKIRRNGQDEDVERLSGGMREQLSVLTRLAFARLLARDGRPAPVILDDALVYSDDDRIERMFDALHRQSRGQQIIVFSCRQRAFSKLGGNVLQMTPWQPDTP